MNCYIVIVNYKRWEDTVDCVRSIFASDYPHIKTLVVDNCSGNESLSNIVQTFNSNPLSKATNGAPVKGVITGSAALATYDFTQLPDLLLVQNERNAGFAAGNNVVLQYLQKQDGYIFLLNPDMTVHPGAISALMANAALKQKTIFGLVTKSDSDKETVLFYGGGSINYLTATVNMLQQWKPGNQLDYISGGALFASTACFREVGLLPERYFLYWEETDWCAQAVKKQYQLDVCVDAVCYDKISTVIGRGFQSDYYYTRNGLMFLKKYAWWGLPTAILLTIPRIAKRILMGQWSRARGVIKGVVDFLIGTDHDH